MVDRAPTSGFFAPPQMSPWLFAPAPAPQPVCGVLLRSRGIDSSMKLLLLQLAVPSSRAWSAGWEAMAPISAWAFPVARVACWAADVHCVMLPVTIGLPMPRMPSTQDMGQCLKENKSNVSFAWRENLGDLLGHAESIPTHVHFYLFNAWSYVLIRPSVHRYECLRILK